MGFKEDLAFGLEKESQIRQIFEEHGAFLKAIQTSRRRDLESVFNNVTNRIEIKNEDRRSTTGNICIEMFQGIPKVRSGILVSEATLTIHTLVAMSAIYRTNEMRLFIEDKIKSLILHVRQFGWSDNFNQGVIVPIRLVMSKPWFDLVATERIPKSPLFSPEGYKWLPQDRI